jgi:hypothetical protein
MKRLCGTPHVVLIAVASVMAALGFAPSALASPGPGPLVSLGSASSFAVIAAQSISNTGPTDGTGETGVWPGTSVTGFPPGIVNGSIHPGDAAAQLAQSDAAAGDQQALGLAATTSLAPAVDIGGQTLTPGVYDAPTSLGVTGTVTLDAQGDPNAVFIIRSGGVLTTAPSSHVELVDGAQASNVYWTVGASATLGAGSTFAGHDNRRHVRHHELRRGHSRPGRGPERQCDSGLQRRSGSRRHDDGADVNGEPVRRGRPDQLHRGGHA